MSGKKKQLFRSWFCRIEHEIMLPFVTVGILVVCAFCAISVYNGYTEKLKDRKEYARTTIRGMEADIYYLQGKLSEDEIRQKYNFYHDPAVRIMAPLRHSFFPRISKAAPDAAPVRASVT